MIWTSALRRCFEVGRVLRRWGWTHHVDARLSELDFGSWDGQAWCAVPVAEIDAWCQDFANGHPGGGESVAQLLERCAAFVADHVEHRCCCVIGHAGWMNALRWITEQTDGLPTAAEWPLPLGYSKALSKSWGRADTPRDKVHA